MKQSRQRALILACGFLLAVMIGAVPQGNPLAVAVIYHTDNSTLNVYSSTTPATDASLAQAIRNATQYMRPGDLVQIGKGRFDFGRDANYKLPTFVTFRGMGMDHTIFTSQVISDTYGTSFALADNTVEDMTLENSCWYDAEDGRATGFDDGPHAATLRRCRIKSKDWTFYNWTANNTATLED